MEFVSPAIYIFIVKHRLGAKNGNADALSRIQTIESREGGENVDFKEITLRHNYLFL